MSGRRRISATERAAQFWAERLRCPPSFLCERGVRCVPHSEPCAVFIVAAGSCVVVAAPPDLHERLRPLESVSPAERILDPRAVEALLPGPAVCVGPAFVGYADSVSPPSAPTSRLMSSHAPELDALRAAVPPHEWRHANLEAAAPPLVAVLGQGGAVCAAGAEVLLHQVAHIGVLTHPAHRGRGLGRQVVAAVASQALSAGLLAQYQTLLSNRPAIAVAHAVGFTQFATTLSFRWRSAAG